MWNFTSLHIPIWVGIFVMGYKLGGGNFEPPPEPEPQEITQADLEWQRCGQYGLITGKLITASTTAKRI